MKSPKAAWLRERQEIVSCLATHLDSGFEQPLKRKEETEWGSQLSAALPSARRPQWPAAIFNWDWGALFTSETFAGVLRDPKV